MSRRTDSLIYRTVLYLIMLYQEFQSLEAKKVKRVMFFIPFIRGLVGFYGRCALGCHNNKQAGNDKTMHLFS
jgi:hypothetical protein